MLERLVAAAVVVGLLLAVAAAVKDEPVDGIVCPLPCEEPSGEPRTRDAAPSFAPPLVGNAPARDAEDGDDEDDEKREEPREKQKREKEPKRGKKAKGEKRGRDD